MSSFMEEGINKELECPICMETFKMPKLLSCMHTCCEECLNGLLKEDGDTKKVVCPVCRHETEINNEINDLHTNFTIQKVVATLEAGTLRAKRKLKCSECEEDFACDFCNDCEIKLCVSCSSYHKRCVRYKGHKVYNITDVPEEHLITPIVKYCLKHDELLKYYCKRCKIVVCHDCTISKAHRGHSFNLIDEVANERREKLRKIISDGKQKHKKHETYVQKVNRFLDGVCTEKDKSVNAITDMFEKLVDALHEKKEELVQQVNENYQKTSNVVQVVKEESKTFENILQFTESIVADGCNTKFMEIYTDIKHQLMVSMAKVEVMEHLHGHLRDAVQPSTFSQQAVPTLSFMYVVPSLAKQADPVPRFAQARSPYSPFRFSTTLTIPTAPISNTFKWEKQNSTNEEKTGKTPEVTASDTFISEKENSVNAEKTKPTKIERSSLKQTDCKNGDRTEWLSLQKKRVILENVQSAIASLTNTCNVGHASDIQNICNDIFGWKEIFFEG